MTKLLIIDDHPMFRDALRAAVTAGIPEAEILEADGLDAGCLATKAHDPDIILLDLSMPGIHGFDGLSIVRNSFPEIPVVVVSAMDDPQVIREALRFGAAGFVSKAMGKCVLAEAISRVLQGGIFVPQGVEEAEEAATVPSAEAIETRISWLTPRQVRVLSMIRQGKLNKQIAFELGVSETTVKAHVSEILRKLGVLSRTQAVIETAALDFDRLLAGIEGKKAARSNR